MAENSRLALLREAIEDMQLGEVKAFDPAKRGAADILFVTQYVDGLDGLGTMEKGLTARMKQ